MENKRLGLELAAANSRMELAIVEAREKMKDELLALTAEKEKLEAQNALLQVQMQERVSALQLKEAEFKLQQLALETELKTLDNEIAKRRKFEEWDSQVNEEKRYLSDPFVDGDLIVSDRRISLNGRFCFRLPKRFQRRSTTSTTRTLKRLYSLSLTSAPAAR